MRQRGTSIEFRDFRDYAAGDDLRHLDWNALARLDAALTKTYRDEQNLLVGIWLDASESMRFGRPEKLEIARALATALGWCALVSGERVHGGILGLPHRSYGGRTASQALSQALCSEPHSATRGRLPETIRLAQSAMPRAGVIVLVTDGLDPDFPRALSMLSKGGNEVWLLQVLAPEEMDPQIEGDLRLVDSEGAGAQEISASLSVLSEYQQNLAAHLRACEDAVIRGGGRYAQVSSEDELASVAKSVLIRERWLA